MKQLAIRTKNKHTQYHIRAGRRFILMREAIIHGGHCFQVRKEMFSIKDINFIVNEKDVNNTYHNYVKHRNKLISTQALKRCNLITS